MIRTLIADDEAPARVRLRQLLAAHPDIEIAGEAATGIQTMELSKQLGPDLLLLDVQMPGCTGIDVAACLAAPRPHIVFCTAFEEHAVDAFELAAVDYLLKPVSRARLAQALERVVHWAGGGKRNNWTKPFAAIATAQPDSSLNTARDMWWWVNHACCFSPRKAASRV